MTKTAISLMTTMMMTRTTGIALRNKRYTRESGIKKIKRTHDFQKQPPTKRKAGGGKITSSRKIARIPTTRDVIAYAAEQLRRSEERLSYLSLEVCLRTHTHRGLAGWKSGANGKKYPNMIAITSASRITFFFSDNRYTFFVFYRVFSASVAALDPTSRFLCAAAYDKRAAHFLFCTQ